MRALFAVAWAGSALFAAPASAESWRMTAYTEEYPALIMFADADSIARSGDSVTFMAQTVFEEDDKGRGTRSVEKIKANCSDMGFVVADATYYNGLTLLRYSDGPSSTQFAKAGSLDEGTILSICGKRDYQSEKIVSPWQYANDWFDDLAWGD